MRDHLNFLGKLVRNARGKACVTVRETNFGYIIRSERNGPQGRLRRRVMRIARAAMWSAALAACLLPLAGVGLLVAAALAGAILLAGHVGLARFRCRGDGIELHVDTSRREVRSAVLTAKGESWIRSSARFGEVSSAVLRQSRNEDGRRSLGLRIAGDEDVMPVAVGDEATLLAVHDRLMRDLRPIEERLAGYPLNEQVRHPPRRVFPQLGPDEIAA